MNKERKPRHYWTLENLKIDALKYRTKMDWNNNSTGYEACKRKGWLDICCVHMIDPSIKYTFEVCQFEASKYKTKKEFNENNYSCYMAAYKNGWLKEICLHMKPLGHKYKRMVYVYEFSDNYAYVGLTCDEDRRKNNHNQKGKVYEHIQKTNIQPIFKQISDYIEVEQAQELEDKMIQQYKENRWNVLNTAKAGGLGGGKSSYTIEKCKNLALLCKIRSEFKKRFISAYEILRKNKFLDESCKHMIRVIMPKNYWTLDRCKEEAMKFTKRIDFKLQSSKCYFACANNKWLREVCYHMS